MDQLRRHLLASLALAAVSVSLGLLLVQLPFMAPFGLKTIDLQFRLVSSLDRVDKRIVLVAVDQSSLDRFDQDNIAFPWPRSLYNPIIEYAAGAGARAVIFDILFNNLSPYGPEVDREFAQAITGAGNVYLASPFFSSQQGLDLQAEPRFGLAYQGTPPETLRRVSASHPLPTIRTATAGIGNVTHRPDVDGIYRRIHPFILFDGRLLPSLSVAPLMDVAAPAVLRDGEIRIGGLRLPVDKEGKMWVNFKGPFDGYRHYSAVDVIQSAILVAEGRPPLVPAEVFKDAYVFVAYTAPGLFDLKPTPVSALSPGVGVHMVVLDNLLNRDFQRPAPFSWVALLAAAGTFLVVAAVILIPAVWLVMVAVTGVFGLIFIGALFSFGQGFGMNLTALGLTALLGLISASMYRYQVEGKNRRFIHKAFSHYLSPKMVSQLLTDPERLVLGGENKELTLFFSDLVGFTTLSERLDAQDLVAVLNDYTSFMADTIAKHEGTLDKYIGDAVMAFWGAPVDQSDQSSKAVLAALECRERLAEFSRELARTRGDIAIDMRIGIDRGQCVVGNMGSARRFDYTAIGNPVNQAARLEGINKVYRTHILMGEAVREVCKDVVFSRVIDYLRVKGREIPVRVYEVMARSGEESDAQRWLKQRYEAAFAAYGRRDWGDAMLILEEILAGEDDDGPANTLLCRVREYQVDPPPPDWDGAFTHTSK